MTAARRRAEDFPHRISWKHSNFSKNNRARLNAYRDRHRGERCVLIANGPSLSKIDLSKVAGERSISMNRAYLLYDTWGFTPTYFVCVNELVLEQFASDIGTLPMPSFLNYGRRNLFSDEDTRMYLRLELSLRDKFSADITKPVSSGGTVTFASLQLAYFMGFQTVILVGLDHNFAEKGIPNTTAVRQSDMDESHCHPDYFPKGSKWQLPDLYRCELAYALARQAFEREGRQILDATIGGKCEVFPKVELSRVLQTSLRNCIDELP